MLLAQRLKFGFSFNILNTLRNLKAHLEASGVENSLQTNLTSDGFD